MSCLGNIDAVPTPSFDVAAIQIQAFVRGLFVRRILEFANAIAVRIQALYRGSTTRRKTYFEKLNAAAIRIQMLARGYSPEPTVNSSYPFRPTSTFHRSLIYDTDQMGASTPPSQRMKNGYRSYRLTKT